MEQSEILARFVKAREFEKATANGWKFKLRLPTDFEERKLFLEARGITTTAAPQHWLREILRASVIGWEGPTLDDLLHEGDKTALPFAPELLLPLLESHLATLDELGMAVHLERKARADNMEAAAKNSTSA